jgi:two-component system chemotaxis sensor kinase CheA
MDSNQRRFIVDVLVVLDEIGEGLLLLDATPDAAAPREQVFQAMHTIRGGANMFGFNALGEMTQYFETLYKLVCQDKISVSRKLLSITTQAFDDVRALLNEKDLNKVNNADALRSHVESVSSFLNDINGIAKGELTHSGGESAEQNKITTFFIRVVPLIEIFEDGKHPIVFILQDLEATGTLKIFRYKKENDCVAHWDLFLSTTETQEVLESYFLFTESDCCVRVTKLLSNNLFDLDIFKQFIRNLISPVDESDLISFMTSLKKKDRTFL